MKQLIITVVLYSLGVLKLTGALTKQQQNGGIAPKLTMVAMADGKAFFVDQTAIRNRTQALNYCSSLGMRLAEITSARQFLALDQAVVEEWINGSAAWTGGIETSGVLRYGWENSTLGVDPSYIPYRQGFPEGSTYFLFFAKYVNASYLQNAVASSRCSSTLCETLSNDIERFQ